MRKLFLGIAILCMCAMSARSDEGIPADTLKALRAAAVVVKAKSTTGSRTGTGFLVWAEGETGLIVTSHTVVAVGQKEIANNVKVTLVFDVGTKEERSVTAEVAASDPGHDLVILKVQKVVDLPVALDPSKQPPLPPKTTFYSLRFPAEKEDVPGKAALTLTKGTVTGLRPSEPGEIAEVALAGESIGVGNGGPVVDAKGRLIGVAIAKTQGRNTGTAIPAEYLDSLLLGRSGPIIISSVKTKSDKLELTLKAVLIDPLRKVKQLELYYLPLNKLTAIPKPGTKEGWDILPKAEKVTLRIEQGEATGILELTSEEKRRKDYYFQAVYVNGASKSLATQPILHFIDFTSTTSGIAEGVRVIDVAAVTELKLPAKGVPPCLCWSKDGKALFHLDADNGILRRIELKEFKTERSLEIGRKCSWLAVSKEGIIVTVSDAQEAWLLTEDTLEVKHKFELGGLKRTAAAPGSSIAVGMAAKGGTMTVFDLATGKVGNEYTIKSFGLRGLDMTNPTMTPDGKYLFTVGSSELHRFKIVGGEIQFEESSQKIVGSQGVNIWATEEFVCAVCGGGNYSGLTNHPELVEMGTYIYPASSFKKPLFTVVQGHHPQAVGFDAKAKLVYSHDDKYMLIFDARGRRLKEVKVGSGRATQFLPHPEGHRVVVLTTVGLYVVDLAKE